MHGYVAEAEELLERAALETKEASFTGGAEVSATSNHSPSLILALPLSQIPVLCVGA